MSQWSVNVGGVWKTLVSPAVKVGTTWHNIVSGWVNVAGVWKLFFAAFTGPVVHTYNAHGSFTETIPLGATTLVIESWGATGGGCQGVGTGCAIDTGAGGGSGGYTRSSYSVAGHGGQTIVLTIGTGGTNGGATSGAGTASPISSGTFSLTTMNPSGGGGAANPTGGGGGAASGGNVANTSGNAGQNTHGVTGGGSGVAGIHGTGPNGGAPGLGAAGAGHPGNDGLAIFYYT